ncbi:MAG: VIT1/CCC1 transporter family protein [Nocardioidaceae bacterium]|nr:VIT1/CCC1 transporter family protein [Nocardioidaceae bacterium]
MSPAAEPDPRSLRRWRQRLADERAEAEVYRSLASRRSGEERAILLGLADAEERHIAHWERLLGEHVGREKRGDLRTRLLAALARRFGSVFVLALAQRAESRSSYDRDRDATAAMAADELIHEEVVRGLAARGRERLSGTFRAAVFGANDGLVSNLALVLGVVGAGARSDTVLLTGLAGLLAGALSMAAGEYISVRSQQELLEASTPGTATRSAVPNLDVDANELALVYRARGMSIDEAQRRAATVLAERSFDPGTAGQGTGHDVVGTGIGAALSSFCFFASGALVPVLPFLVGLEGTVALVVAAGLVSLALMFTGAVVGLMSGGPPLVRAARQLAIGLGAAGITYLLGLLFGATLG